MSGRARGAWPLSHPPSLLSAPTLVLGEHAFPAEIAQLSDSGNNMIYGTHEIRMDSRHQGAGSREGLRDRRTRRTVRVVARDDADRRRGTESNSTLAVSGLPNCRH